MFVDELITRIEGEVPELASRTHGAAELSELLRQDALPQSPIAAYVLPLGLRGRSEGEAGAGYFVQNLDEIVGVLIVIRIAGDVSGSKALPAIDSLVDQLILKVAGWAPNDTVAGVFRVSRGDLVSAQSGTVIYQLDFAIQTQIRNL